MDPSKIKREPTRLENSSLGFVDPVHENNISHAPIARTLLFLKDQNIKNVSTYQTVWIQIRPNRFGPSDLIWIQTAIGKDHKQKVISRRPLF